MKIVTDYWRKPIPTDVFDWEAYDSDTYDGTPDSGPIAHLCGRGPTEEDAIRDLKTLMAEHDLCCECGAQFVDERCVGCGRPE